jgi:hypothetical protein
MAESNQLPTPTVRGLGNTWLQWLTTFKKHLEIKLKVELFVYKTSKKKKKSF